MRSVAARIRSAHPCQCQILTSRIGDGQLQQFVESSANERHVDVPLANRICVLGQGKLAEHVAHLRGHVGEERTHGIGAGNARHGRAHVQLGESSGSLAQRNHQLIHARLSRGRAMLLGADAAEQFRQGRARSAFHQHQPALAVGRVASRRRRRCAGRAHAADTVRARKCARMRGDARSAGHRGGDSGGNESPFSGQQTRIEGVGRRRQQ